MCPIVRDLSSCTFTNYAVTCLRDTLVIPQARIFNDSSVALSRDGRLIAAVVAPPYDHGGPDVLQVDIWILCFTLSLPNLTTPLFYLE